jgi:hypothetical protein
MMKRMTRIGFGAIAKAFSTWRARRQGPRTLRFVAAASADTTAEAARRAGELDYEPRSWR